MADSPNLFQRLWNVAKFVLGASYVIAAIGVTAGGLAFVVGYANRKSSEFSSEINNVIGDNLYDFVLTFRYEIVIVSLAAIFSAFWIKQYLNRRKLTKISRLCDDFLFEFERLRDFLWVVLTLEANEMEISSDKYASILRETQGFLESSAGTLQKLFTLYTGSHCHIAIKTFNKEKGEVLTVARDRISDTQRRAIDEYMPSIKYQDNTAFKRILDDKRIEIYCNNHLLISKWLNKYRNSHEGWESFYRAAIVVPITRGRHSANITKDNVLGFLAIDNKGGGFDGTVCANLLVSFSRIYYGLFQVVARVHCGEEVPETMLPDGGLKRWAQY